MAATRDYRPTKAAGINRAVGGTRSRALESRITIFCHRHSFSLSLSVSSLSLSGSLAGRLGARTVCELRRGQTRQAIYRHPQNIDFFPTFL